MNVRHFGGPLIVAAAILLAACGGDKAPPAGDASSTPAAAVQAPAAAPAEAPVANPVAAEPSPGEKVYQGTCVMCHGSPAVGAPVLGNKDDWAPRIAQGKDVLYKHALEGFSGQKGAMPAHGGNPSLDDDKVKAAVDFMVSKAQ
ncbi:cytochrome c5 family protein [Dyella solisilvae]|uniref:Cytochrome c5 family protein n=1 Tax=Dyella solisilvae TaxID=1920168 RepID=A0A370K752_9GAMM|nr:c-type cytochrome [Dyella solisilvae]RDI98489.1 cytochrome c5 family protein [Dyella solisilvae]